MMKQVVEDEAAHVSGVSPRSGGESPLSFDDKREFIDFLVGAGALQFGEFTTKSGRKTPYFVNTGRFDDGRKISTLGRWYGKAIIAADPGIQTVFGPAYKGVPLAVATSSAMSEMLNKPVGYTFNRKEAKTHGDGGLFVGFPLHRGGRVALVEDVITAGTTMREVLPILSGAGVTVTGVYVAVDRMERAQDPATGELQPFSAVEEVRRSAGVKVYPLITLIDVIEYVRTSENLVHLLPAIEDYRGKYGI